MTWLAQMINNGWDEQTFGDVVQADYKVNEILQRTNEIFSLSDWLAS